MERRKGRLKKGKREKIDAEPLELKQIYEIFTAAYAAVPNASLWS